MSIFYILFLCKQNPLRQGYNEISILLKITVIYISCFKIFFIFIKFKYVLYIDLDLTVFCKYLRTDFRVFGFYIKMLNHVMTIIFEKCIRTTFFVIILPAVY